MTNIYFDTTKNSPPNPLLVEAVNIANKGQALDIGAGAMNDTRYLLEKGFYVTAVDKSVESSQAAQAISLSTPNMFTFFMGLFQNFSFDKTKFDLVNAHWSLSFVEKTDFLNTIRGIKYSLLKGGIFCGQIYGDKDGWASNKKMTFLTRAKFDELFADMEILKFEEENQDLRGVQGETKHWHVFHFILKKK